MKQELQLAKQRPGHRESGHLGLDNRHVSACVPEGLRRGLVFVLTHHGQRGLLRGLCEIVYVQQENARASGEVQASSWTSGLCSLPEMVHHSVSQVAVSIHTPSRLQRTE